VSLNMVEGKTFERGGNLGTGNRAGGARASSHSLQGVYRYFGGKRAEKESRGLLRDTATNEICPQGVRVGQHTIRGLELRGSYEDRHGTKCGWRSSHARTGLARPEIVGLQAETRKTRPRIAEIAPLSPEKARPAKTEGQV